MKASELLVACLENEGVEFLFALPMKIRGGTGGPVRIIALLP